MSDVTKVFHSCVNAYRTQTGKVRPHEEILKPQRTHSQRPFDLEKRAVSEQLDTLFQYVYLHSAKYLNFVTPKDGTATTEKCLTDAERDSYEQVILENVKRLKTKLQALESMLPQDAFGKNSAMAHDKTVVLMLQERHQRAENVLKQHQIMRMKSHIKMMQQLAVKEDDLSNEDVAKRKQQMDKVKQSHKQRYQQGAGGTPQDEYDEFADDDVDDELLTRELEQENHDLATQLNSEMEATEQLERDVHKLIDMMNFLNDQLIEQKATIEELGVDTEHSTSHIEKAIDHVQSAKEHGSQFTTVFVGVIVVLALILLLIDWLNI